MVFRVATRSAQAATRRAVAAAIPRQAVMPAVAAPYVPILSIKC